MKRTILVTGATGTVGARLAQALSSTSDLDVRALVRDPGRAEPLAGKGVDVRRGTFDDHEALGAALDGVDTLVLITATGAHAAEQASSVIRAARAARVRKVVRLSAIRAAIDGPTDNTRQHARTEDELRASGMVFVALRPQYFMQNLLGSLGSLLGEGKLYSGVGTARIGMIDARDVADALEAAVRTADFDGQTLEVTGPKAVTHEEVAAAAAAALGRPVAYVPVPPEAAGEAVRSFADEWTVTLVTDYMRAYASGFGDFVTDAIPRLTGHPARTVEDFARDVLAPAARRAP
jgi:uncharacterized protein YbjT (DUF2867 family)